MKIKALRNVILSMGFMMLAITIVSNGNIIKPMQDSPVATSQHVQHI